MPLVPDLGRASKEKEKSVRERQRKARRSDGVPCDFEGPSSARCGRRARNCSADRAAPAVKAQQRQKEERRTRERAWPHLEREKQREPAEHLWADDVLPIRMDREANGTVEMGLKVAAEVFKGAASGSARVRRGKAGGGRQRDRRQAVQGAGVRDVEGQATV